MSAGTTPFHDLSDFVGIPRVGALRLAPDGTWLAAAVQTLSADKKKYLTSIWRIDPHAQDTRPVRLTRGAEGEGDPVFLPDGSLLFVSGHGPMKDGKPAIVGKLGADLGVEDGRKAGHTFAQPDLIIAATALEHGLTVVSRDTTDYELARSLGIDSRAITAARNLATRQANGETGWAPQLRELLDFAKVTKIFGLDTALANLAGVAPAEDRDVVADTLAKTFGKTVAPLALGRQI